MWMWIKIELRQIEDIQNMYILDIVVFNAKNLSL